MCGIIAEVANRPIELERFNEMRDQLRHRGPDGAGTYLNDDGTTALGSRRLAIIDPTATGNMPLSNENERIWIVYNGELYNYRQLRAALQDEGHEFASDTDTEVIIHAYEEWGSDCVNRFRGMFAFALWDDDAGQLFCARDRFGIKPFYFYATDSRLVAASELKAIINDPSIPRTVDADAVDHFLRYRYIPAPLSIWEGIEKLPPAHTLRYDGDQVSVDEYWNLEEGIREKRDIGEAEALTEIEKILTDATEEHLVSDVPLSILLSGGIDSSVITAIVSEHLDQPKTYSIGFEGQEDELPYARTVAEAYETQHTERLLSKADMAGLLDDLVYYYDEPLGDSSIFPTYLVMDAISQDYKVALSGDGGDEVFAGYNWYTRYQRYRQFEALSGIFSAGNRILSLVPDSLDNRYVDAIRSRLEPFSHTGLDRYRKIMAPRFDRGDVAQVLSRDFQNELSEGDVPGRHAEGFETVTDLQTFDIKTFLVDDILVKVDRASMANSLEVRVPYLDHRLIEYVLSLESDIVCPDGEKKHLLKTIGIRLLPDTILDRKKTGFSAPLDEMGFIHEQQDVLRDSRAARAGIFDQGAIDTFLDDATGSARDQAQIWLLIVFELWYREWGTPLDDGDSIDTSLAGVSE